jgi:streptomycin 3"-adenylyltransferase
VRDADRQQVDRVVALLRETLGAELEGAWLYGSAVQGGLRPRSDLDVFALARRRTTLDEKRRLGAALLGSSAQPRPIELTIAVASELRPWRYPPCHDFQYGDWLRADFEQGRVEPQAREHPDLALLVSQVLAANTPLVGPPPAQRLDPVPRADVVRALRDAIPGLLDNLGPDTRNVLLTLARIWTTLATGAIRSKEAAAEWALALLPEDQRTALGRARAIHLGEEPERWDDLAAQLRPQAERLVAEIRRLGA